MPRKAAAKPVEAPLKSWPADQVERWPLARIKPYPRNARLHSDEQVAQIAASMKKFGVTTPLLVDEDGVLIFGHGRRRAAELLGYKELPVSIARGWTEDEKKGYRIADNQLALTSEWDSRRANSAEMPRARNRARLCRRVRPALGSSDRQSGDAGGHRANYGAATGRTA